MTVSLPHVPLFIFGSQGPANFAEQLVTLIDSSRDDPNLTAFFQLAGDAIHAELISLGAKDLAVLPDVSKFRTLTSLARYHEAHGYENATVNGILLATLQAAQIVGLVSKTKAGDVPAIFSEHARFAGFCTGDIIAAALSVKLGNVWDLIRQGLETIRLVFWISLRSHQAIQHLDWPFTPYESIPYSYALALNGASTQDALNVIAKYNVLVGASPDSKVTATAFSSGSISVGGPPMRLSVFADWVNSKQAGIAARCVPLRIFSPYHNAVMEPAVDQVVQDILRRRISLFGSKLPTRILYDPVAGHPLAPDSWSAEELTLHLIRSNLVYCNRFDLLSQRMAHDLDGHEGVVDIFCAAPSPGLASNVAEALQDCTPSINPVHHDLLAAPDAKGAAFISRENEEIAIVAMSCRLPGGIQNPDQFWESLQQGNRSVSEIPKHLFDVNKYYGDGVNQMRVRHMHALPEDVTTTMDIRIPNISPKEAEQMDPQHRLAILCAYEALEKAGYSTTASQSFDNRRIAYFAAVTGDDYRENASGAPGGISSYFVSGCIRAFIPGAFSFAFNLEGPSISLDTGETSSLVALEHATHALMSRQCDVALAGGFNVLTSPHMFIGMDVDGLLSHSDENESFSANNTGVTRGDGAVCFALKRLSDAVAEGDQIIATLPAIAHETLPENSTVKDQQDFLTKMLRSRGLPPSSVAHAELSGYSTAKHEAMQVAAADAALRDSASARPLTIGMVKANVGASESALGAVQVMKAALMVQHGIVPPQPPVADVNSEVQSIIERGRSSVPFGKTAELKPTDSVLVHGLAHAGNQAAVLVKAAPKVKRAETPTDNRGSHVFSISAKSLEAVQNVRKALLKYVTPNTSLLRLSYTLMARRLHHPFRVTFAASTFDEFKERLGSNEVHEVREATPKPEIVVNLGGEVSQSVIAALCSGDPTFRDAYESTAKMIESTFLTDSLDTSGCVDSLRAEIAFILMLRTYGIVPAKIAAQGTGLLSALVAAGVSQPAEAVFTACLMEHHSGIVQALQRLDHRIAKVPIEMPGSGLIVDAGQPLKLSASGALESLTKHGHAVSKESENELVMSLAPWSNLCESLARCHSSGFSIDWNNVFRPYLPGMQHLSDLPTYPFTLTRHWLEYHDRNLIRRKVAQPKAQNTEKPVVKHAPPRFPMLGEITSFALDGENCSAVYRFSCTAEPMVRFIKGHLVNGVALAPATLWADLCLEAATDIFERTHGAVDDSLMPQLKELNIVRPLTITDSAADPAAVEIKITGAFDRDLTAIEICSISGQGTATSHMTAKVNFSNVTDLEQDWQRFSSLIEERFHAVRASDRADVIASKLAYNAFETVVSYTADSGFRGIQSVALLSEKAEAATIVRMSPDVPTGTYVFNPCHIDSLGQITGFICNSLCVDAKSVYIADGVNAMRFSPKLNAAVAKNDVLHAYSQMTPAEDGSSYTGDAFFFNSQGAIVGEMQGVRYKKVPRSVLDLLLPRKKADKAKKAPAAKADAPPPAQKRMQARSSNGKVASTLTKILDAIAVELGIEVSSLEPDTSFADLGLDSLMAIVILGSLTQLPVELPPSLFLDCLTPKDVRQWLERQLGADEGNEADGSPADETPLEPETHPMTPAASPEKARVALDKARTIIATELGITEEELGDDVEVAELGLDSLMSLLVLSNLNSELGVELPPSLFLDHANLKELGHYFDGIFKSPERSSGEGPPITERRMDAATTANLLKGVRIQPPVLIQKAKSSDPKLFLLPDGSGAAAVYSGLPELGTCSLYGVNSPFMGDASQWKGGVAQLALAYLESIRTVQPQGPYYIGGWSFGGVAAFEMARILDSSASPSDKVEVLLLLDSPSPARFPPLPMSIVDWIFSSADIPTPPTLSKRLVAHFQATVDALADYGVPPAIASASPSNIALLTAAQGLNVKDEVPDANPTVKWLINARCGLGSNGWEALLPKDRISVHQFEANHFTMMHAPYIEELAKLIRNVFLK